jgi:hypothetical protein
MRQHGRIRLGDIDIDGYPDIFLTLDFEEKITK